MANFWERARSATNVLLGRKSSTLDLFREIYGARAQTWAGKAVTLDTALQVSTALACGRVIAESVSLMPWKVYRASGRTREPARGHYLFDKLATSPNPLQTAFEFQETLGLHLAFCGNAYVWMPTVRGRIDAMYLVEPGWVTVKWRWPDPPTYEVRPPDGRTIPMTPENIWHIRGPSWSSYSGLQFIELARQALGLSMAIEEGQSRMYSQGVQTSGFLSVDGSLTKDQHKKLAEWLEQDHASSANSGRPMILDRAAKWMTQSMSNVDAQTLEQRRNQVEEVCRFMRVLPIMVGHSDKTATYASAEQMFLAHQMYTSGPIARRIEQSADKRLLTPEERAAGYYTNLNEKALLRMTAKEQMEYLARGVLTGIYTQNEAREKLDENPIDGHDQLLSPTNMIVGQPSGEPASKPDAE